MIQEVNISDDSCYYSPCKACGLDGIDDFITHVLDVLDNYKYHYEDYQHRKIEVFKSFYGTFCWNYTNTADFFARAASIDFNISVHICARLPRTSIIQIGLMKNDYIKRKISLNG
jgi:hypothetical protein